MSTDNEVAIELPKSAKVAYSSANTASNILSGIGLTPITFFYNTKLGLSAQLMFIAWMIFMVWNAINDPLLGYIQDKTKTSLGRRVPYLRYGAPIYGILFIMLWFPLVDISNEMALFGYYLLMLFLFDTIFTSVGIITYILPAEMTVSSTERGSLMVYATVIGLFGYLITFIVPMLFLTGDESSYIDPAFLISMVIIGIACAIILFVSSYFIKENEYTALEDTLDFKDSIKESFKNKPFLILQAANFAGILTSTIITSAIFYYVDYVLVLEDAMSVVPILVVLLIAFPSTYVYLRVIPKYGLKKINIFGYCMICISFTLLIVLGWDLSTALISLIILGVGYGASLITSQILFADTVDYDETLTGKRRESTYSGVEALLTKPAISVANALFLLIISVFGFNSELTTPQPIRAQWGIMIGFTVMPIICALIAAIVMTFYPLDGPEWDKQKEELEQIHERKEREYIEYLKNKGTK